MSGALYNLAAMTVASTGTGTITLGSAAKINGVQYLSFASAGVPDGQPVYYSINDPGGSGASEIGIGTYTSSGTTLTRSVITSTNSNSAINMSASAIVRISPPTSQFREVLTTARSYYVNGSTGSDSNTGLSSGAAFATIQKALDTVAMLDININNVTISVADGTYTGANIVSGPWLGSGTVSIVGNVTTPGNVVINPPGGTCFLVQNGGSLSISGVETRGNAGLYAGSSGIITVTGPVRFGATNAYQVYATSNGQISIGSNYTISGGALVHVIAEFGGIITATSLTVTLTGTPAFTTFAQATRSGSYIGYYLNTFSGSATGQRYTAASGGFIDVNLAGTTYLPGNSAGTGTNYGVSPYGLYT